VLHVDQTAPGGWLAATAPGRLVVVRAPEDAEDLIRRLWAALAGGIQPVLDVLTSGGLTATPAFALAEWSGDADHGFDVRFIVRGAASVEITSDAGGRSIDASGVSTWLEQPVAAVRAFRVDCDGAQAGGGMLPLGLGAAWVRSVSFGGDREEQDAEAGLSAGSLSAGEPPAPVGTGRAASVAAPAASAPAAAPAEPEPIADVTVVEPFGDDVDETPDEVSNETLDESGEENAVPAAVPAPENPTGYDHLFGATVMRSVEEAAVRPADEEDVAEDAPAQPETHTIAPPPFVTDPTASTAGDHDGFTVLSGDINALRASRPASTGPAQEPPAPPATPTFRLQLSNGTTEPLAGTVIVGRAPSVSKVPGTQVPHLVTVDTPDHDISRNHVQLTLEGDTVVVTDLHSRNGTMIVLPGKTPQKLRQGEPTSVIVGTVVDLGGGVTLTVGQE